MSSPTASGGPWPPRAPLSVTRLAKIANSFGYNLPSASTDSLRRTPSPNPLTVSSYVLEVIPPQDLPHDDNDVLTPPPSSATGYHPRYERGVLVPVKPTLQSQLGAIAREYALPSTTGLVLYLVNEDSPGPRMTEAVWKMLWSRVIASDTTYIPPPTPRTLNLLSPGIHRGSPYSSSVASSSSGHLLHPSSVSIPSPRQGSPDILPPTPSVSSSVPSRSFTRSAPPPSSASPTDTTSASELGQEPDTPLTSADPSTRANSLESPVPSSFELTLPGLGNPHALVPILAKVEFDIDKNKATWFTPWIRSRRMNHAKRRAASESRPAQDDNTSEAGQADDSEKEKAKEKGKKPIIDLTIGTKDPMPFSHVKGEYAPLSDSPIEEIDQDMTIRLRDGAKDPLADVFGEDEEQWGMPSSQHTENENVVPLALTPSALSALEAEDLNEEVNEHEEVDEVQEMLNAMRSPTSPKSDRTSTTTLRKNAPPPLVLRPLSHSTNTSQQSPGGTGVEASLPYLRRTSDDDGAETSPEIDPSTGSSSGKSERRKRAIYDDVDWDLSEVETKEQARMKEELDAIEKTLYQLSPRNFEEFEKQQQERDEIAKTSPTPSTRTSKASLQTPDSGRTLTSAAKVEEASVPEEEQEPGETDDEAPAWPATPFAVLKQRRASGASSRSSKSSAGQRGSSSAVPQLAVNGISTGAPPSFNPSMGSRKTSLENGPNSETARRRKEAEEEDSAWQQSKQRGVTSPIIPLSPDPFGRFSSSNADPSGGGSRSSVYWEDDQPIASSTQRQPEPGKNGRPSVDSSHSSTSSKRESLSSKNSKEQKDANRTTLISVKGIKNLWRKSGRNQSISLKNGDVPPLPPSPALPSVPASPLTPATPAFPAPAPAPNGPARPVRPSRPTEELMDLPTADEVESSTAPLRVPAMLGGGPGAAKNPPPGQGQPSLSAAPPASVVSEKMPPPPPGVNLPPPQTHSHGHNPPYPGPMPRSNSLFPNGPIPLHPTGPNVGRPRIGSNAGPIVPTKMLPGGGRSAVMLSFDQETPYPIPQRKASMVPPFEDRPARTPSPSAAGAAINPSTSPPLPAESGRRRSILKSRSSGSISHSNPSPPPSPSSKGRRPSILGRNPSLQATQPDIPPSPQIPQQFLSRPPHARDGSRSSTSLKSKSPSLHSLRSGGSRSSHETPTEPEEIADGDFEMITARTETKQLSYPYTDT